MSNPNDVKSEKLCRLYATFSQGALTWKVISYPFSFNEVLNH